MTFPSGLKRICDVCFYMTFASLIGSGDLIFTLPFFAVVTFLSAFLAKYGVIKYISILPLFLMFFVIQPTVSNIAILIPIIIYLFWSMPKAGERVAQFNYIPVFRLFIKTFSVILGIFMLISLWFNTTEFEFPRDSLLFGFTFLLTSVIVLRLIRHDEAVSKQLRFKMINSLPLVGISIGTLLISRSFFVDFILSIIRFIWQILLFPIFLIIMWIAANIVNFIFGFFNIGNLDPVALELPDFLEAFADFVTAERDLSSLIGVLIGIMIVLGIIMIRLIFKFLSDKIGSPIIRDDGIEEEHFTLEGASGKRNRYFGNRKENQVRSIYRNFLALAKKNNIELPLHFTSDEIAGRMSYSISSENSKKLRDAYIQSRYGDVVYTKDDIKQIKQLYKSIKEEIESFS